MAYEPYWAAQRRASHPFDRPSHLRKVARVLGLSQRASTRLEWFLWREEHRATIAVTCRRFGMTPKTYHHWAKRFDRTNLRTLEDRPKTPHRRRQKEYTPIQYERIVRLRRQFLRYGKRKLFPRYQEEYPEDSTLTLWHVQCIIQSAGIYPKPAKHARTQAKRRRAQTKKRLTELKLKPRAGFLFLFDTVLRTVAGVQRTIVTAIDRHAKLAFARMYPSRHTRHTADFLVRLHALVDGKIERVGHDNGSEFQGAFAATAQRLDLPQYWTRPRTPKDNAVCERFNRTLSEEFLQMGNLTSDIPAFNRNLTEWLIEYNLRRPHATLGYVSPMCFIQTHSKLLPMSSSDTRE